MNYYNEWDKKTCAWLMELIAEKLIPEGIVDDRSITEVRADDLVGFKQCHFFAGIGGWPLALRLAGVPDDAELWTGSCPCQPFSVAGKGLGHKDPRDLWPVFFNLIRECKPPVVIGEQVASAEVVGSGTEADFFESVQAGDFARANKLAKRLARSSSFHYHRRWLDRVHADLESAGYAVGAAVLGAHSVGAPHIRQRLYWGGVRVSDAPGGRHAGDLQHRHTATGNAHSHGQNFWSASVWHPCRDGKWRRVPAACDGGVCDPTPRGRRECWDAPLTRDGRHTIGTGGTGYVPETPPQPGVLPVADGVPAFVGGGGAAGDGGVQGEAAGWKTPTKQEPGIKTGRLVDKDGMPWVPGQRAHNNDTGRLAQTGLEQMVQFSAGWPTAQAHDAVGGKTEAQIAAMRERGHGVSNLNEVAALAGGRATPRADSFANRKPGTGGEVLPEQVERCGPAPPHADPDLFPLAPPEPGRVALLHGAGNAIVPQCAAVFVEAFLDAASAIESQP